MGLMTCWIPCKNLLEKKLIWVKSRSSWGRAQHPLVISSSTQDDGESCGRGILSKETIGEGELLLTIPLDICLTRKVAQEILGKAIIPDYMDEYIAIAVLMMSEKIKGEQSKWKPYFDILPSVEEVNPAYVWSDEELRMLLGSPTYPAAKSLRKKIETEFDELQSTPFSRNGQQFPPQLYTFDLFLWSFVILFSRAARLTSKLDGEELALVPYADLMNHNPYSNTYIDSQTSGGITSFINKKEEVAIYSDRSYKKFEQVFISYGEKSNSDLLLLYGFALERNPYNAVDITVGLSKEDPLYTGKRAYLAKSGRDATSVRFPLQQSRYPSELVDFLRLLLVEPDDIGIQPLERIDFNEPISPSLERRVLRTIIGVCESYLERYPTTLSDDENFIMNRSVVSTLTRQQRMSVKLRASEKRILNLTIEAVNEELSKMPSVTNLENEISPVPAGRSFDTLLNAPKIGTTRGPSDWVENRLLSRGRSDINADNVVERRRKRRE